MAAILRKLGKDVRKKPSIKTKNLDEEKAANYRNVTQAEKNEQSIRTFREENNLPESEISSIIFSLFDEKTINNISVCEVKNVNKSYDLSFSTDDPRLGTIENNKLCATCGKSNQDCTGHMGKIELPVSIIHPFYREFVIMVLQSICFTCNKLLVTEKMLMDKGYCFLKGKNRLAAIAELCKEGSKMRCTNPKCGPRPTFFTKSYENDTRYVIYKIKVGKKDIQEYITVETIKMKLDAISDSDVKLLGFENNHPRNFIVNFVPVIPLCARPYIVREGERSDDYITSTYCNILNKKIESIQQVEDDRKEVVYEQIIDYIRFMIEGMKASEQGYSKSSKKDNCKSIFERVSKKQGIIRKHLLGKRTDFTGRTVIGPNGKLQFNHIALPALMRQVTIPEFATKYNLSYLRELGRKGEISYFCPREGSSPGIKLNFNINRHNINLGDKVGRYTQSGDIVLGNRQPTLHVQSMIGQEVDFQEKGSMGIHLSSTPGLNADFDGDEGNVHFLQTTDAQTEAKIIMSATNTIMSNSDSKPQSYFVYSSISGAYMLTSEDTMFTKEEFWDGISSMDDVTSSYIKDNLSTLFQRAEIDIDNVDVIPGRVLCSVIFPPTFWYRRDDELYIVNGIIKKGRLSKKYIGSSHGSLVQSFVKWHGNKITADFISAGNFLFNWYVGIAGLSISIDDCLPSNLEEFEKFKEKEVRTLNSKFISFSAQKGSIGKREEIKKKMEMITENKNIIQAKLVSVMPKNNNLNLMKDSGAKGSDENNMHMIGFKGQVFIGSTLPEKKMTGGKRWLSTFSVYDETVYASGFSSRSFLQGLEPDSFFAMAQEGRLNVCDRQLKTAKTGYMQRKIIKAQEDLIVGYDGAVYGQTGKIVQFTNGPGFAVNRMVQDVGDSGERFFSFIDTRELCGRVNSANGMKRYSISDEVVNSFNDVLSEFDYEVKVNIEKHDEGEEEFDYDDRDTIEENDYDEEDMFDEGDDFE